MEDTGIFSAYFVIRLLINTVSMIVLIRFIYFNTYQKRDSFFTFFLLNFIVFLLAYMLEKTGMGEKDVTAEVERYIVDPGQACAYKVGMLKIRELRERAQRELGDKFDQREFHDAVLKNGALPLEILEEQINLYIHNKQAAFRTSNS